MTVRQRAKRRPIRSWASQYSHNTGLCYFLSPHSVGEVTMFYDYCDLEAWSKPK